LPDEDDFWATRLPKGGQSRVSSSPIHPPVVPQAPNPISREKDLDEVQHGRPYVISNYHIPKTISRRKVRTLRETDAFVTAGIPFLEQLDECEHLDARFQVEVSLSPPRDRGIRGLSSDPRLRFGLILVVARSIHGRRCLDSSHWSFGRMLGTFRVGRGCRAPA